VADVFSTLPGRIEIRAEDAVNEGGHITLQGSGANPSMMIDNFAGDLRFFDSNVGLFMTVKQTSGNVGIGTISPDHYHLPRGSTGYTTLTIEPSLPQRHAVLELVGKDRTDQGGYGAIIWTHNLGGTFYNVARIDARYDGANDAGFLQFSTTPINQITPVERMRISSEGNVGIGATNPGNKLDIKGTGYTLGIDITNTDSTRWGGVHIFNDLGHIGYLLGVGSANPSTGSGSIYEKNGVTLVSDGSGGLGLAARNPAGNIHFYSGGSSERMTIDSTGEIGIGVSTPSKKLHIGPNLHSSGDGLLLDGVMALAWGQEPPAPPAGQAYIWLHSSDGALKVKFSNGAIRTIANP
jgi:hypothetical protein